MEYLLMFISVALGAFIGVVGALLTFKRVEHHLEHGKEVLSNLMQSDDDKTEFLYPMDEEESEQFEFDQTEEGRLMKELEEKKPWLFSRSKKKTQ